jgi:hypothetical protein
MRQTRLHLLLATILTVNLIGVGVLVARTAERRPLLAAPAAALRDAGLPTDAGHVTAAAGGMPSYDPSAAFAAPDQLPGPISVAPDSG